MSFVSESPTIINAGKGIDILLFVQFAQRFKSTRLKSPEKNGFLLWMKIKVINKKVTYLYMFLSYKPFYPHYQQKITTFVVSVKSVSRRNFVLSFVINLQEK